MADDKPRESSHARSKSALALTLLHRDKSKVEDPPEQTSASEPASPNDAMPSTSPSVSATSPQASSRKFRNSRTNLETLPDVPPTAMLTTGQASVKSPEIGEGITSEGAPSVMSKTTSIEHSVRKFRIFEALRGGDTSAISKVIRETAPPTSGNEGQGPSTLPTSSHGSISSSSIDGTSILHLAIQCAEPQVIEYVLSFAANTPNGIIDINARDKDGNTPLHLAAMLGRLQIVRLLLDHPNINDAVMNYQGRTALDLARTPEIFQQLQLTRSLFVDEKVREIQRLVGQCDYDALEKLVLEPRVAGAIDVNGTELVTDPVTASTGGTLLHEAARKRDNRLIQLLLMHGADPFKRDRKGKLPQDITKDDKTRGILKRSPAAAVARNGIQEKAIMGNLTYATASSTAGSESALGGKEGREMKGYLKKWTNYTSGYKLRWFVLEDGVLSYYKHQDDANSACRGAINMRIAKLHMDPQDKTRFEIHGKSSVKYHLKANHVVEAKRWFWALNNAIQWSKDEAKEEERRKFREAEMLRQARIDQAEKTQPGGESVDGTSFKNNNANGKGLTHVTSNSVSYTIGAAAKQSVQGGSVTATSINGDDKNGYEPSFQTELHRYTSHTGTGMPDGDIDEEDDYGDDSSDRDVQPTSKDAFNITAQSVKLQLDLLSQVSSALQAERSKSPDTSISDPTIAQALTAYNSAASSLHSLVSDLLKISRDRDAYWQYRLDREIDVRKMWEDSMARVAREQEELENRIGESEEKRRRTKRILREALESEIRPLSAMPPSDLQDEFTEALEQVDVQEDGTAAGLLQPTRKSTLVAHDLKRKATLAQLNDLSDDESEADDEFFDAVDAGEIKVMEMPTVASPVEAETQLVPTENVWAQRARIIESAWKGYEDGPRQRLKLDADDRPKISLWGILKSMIGKDMSKMTLPVTFNEPTSLLQRVAEDMEYTDLLDHAAERADSAERLVYVAAFAASEYASTINRVAKPFNPLLGETYEYCRPDKGFRFFVEQVSHHPPIGAAYGESAKWEYYGESSVKSKFYGKSFDVNPLGSWFLHLRPVSGGEELYTWKKVTTTVIGIITGNPTIDNYGPMEIKNWTTGEKCILDFKPRGWKVSSAYHVTGKVADKDGTIRWTIGGRWNDKIYARLTPGYEGTLTPPNGTSSIAEKHEPGSTKAFLVWEANLRPSGVPFNLTSFAITLNDINERLRPRLAPTDTRLRPDQRAMEEGEYEFAADEKVRLEEKQRSKRREREASGEVFVPRWFEKSTHEMTGESYWRFNQEYWKCREAGDWTKCEDIF